jgi:hypothetical protein
MTEVIARREYQLTIGDGTTPVVVQVGKPAPFPDAPYGDWYCPYTIEIPNDESWHREAGGVDALQALLLAISAIRAHLDWLGKSGKLIWLDENLGLDLVGSAP